MSASFQNNVAAIARNIQSKDQRISDLETVLNRMVCAHENCISESEGRFPVADAGCPDCTSGCVPDRLNTGRCAYHEAKVLLGQL